MIALVVCEWKLVYIHNDEDDYEHGFVVAFILLSLSRQYRISPLFPDYNGKFCILYRQRTLHAKVTYTIQGVFFFFNSFCVANRKIYTTKIRSNDFA